MLNRSIYKKIDVFTILNLLILFVVIFISFTPQNCKYIVMTSDLEDVISIPENEVVIQTFFPQKENVNKIILFCDAKNINASVKVKVYNNDNTKIYYDDVVNVEENGSVNIELDVPLTDSMYELNNPG